MPKEDRLVVIKQMEELVVELQVKQVDIMVLILNLLQVDLAVHKPLLVE